MGALPRQSIPYLEKYNITPATEWLVKHPITGEDDISFILRTIAVRRDAAEKVAAERANKASALTTSGANWIGKYPVLHLIHALVDDDEIKREFLTCHNLTGGRLQLEN